MEYSVIPQPAHLKQHGDAPVFRLTRLCNLHADEKSRLAKEELLRFLEQALEFELVGTCFCRWTKPCLRPRATR